MFVQLTVKQDIVEQDSCLSTYYFQSLPQPVLTSSSLSPLLSSLSDAAFFFGVDTTAKLHAQRAPAPTYVHYITHAPGRSFANVRSAQRNREAGKPQYEVLR